VLASVISLSGCSTINGILNSSPEKTNSYERDFAGALQHLRSGNEQKAFDLFEKVVNGPKIYGITDEALFRLAVLQLRDDSPKSAARAERLLERLKKDFPKSIWRHQAEPLISFIDSTADLRKSQRELKSLRELNVSLTRNNKELRQTIERLKELDIELENKIRR